MKQSNQSIKISTWNKFTKEKMYLNKLFENKEFLLLWELIYYH